ncbi:hypothetical protein F858_gp28 [Escherichia phage mEp234]|uniref:Uncharacterized protein n=1 Tax=Escherichia phage mEp234 TaxID=1147157 RepID=K7PH41_9CAUD|nr:hypothetical protein F858_gp28 [Escherichia phage mEp234]AFM76307.1 hypothetical protein mEp234_028 [Escherichia phage mEp234]
MAHSITVRLNKPAREFQAGENIGFNIRAGVQYYDRQTKKKEWTNYSAVRVRWKRYLPSLYKTYR